MGYLHINNLYKDDRIFQFDECYALEKIHGTSAHLAWRDGALTFFSGGEKYERFVALFDEKHLREGFAALGQDKITIYGEAYGGSQQKQSWRYGPDLRFVAFDVKIEDTWLMVQLAHLTVAQLGLEFVYYKRVPTTLEALDAERDAISQQAIRNDVVGHQPREGIVIRPLEERLDHRGERIITKHKRDEERETATPRKVVDAGRLEVLKNATAIAEEWVTPYRLEHVLDKLGRVGVEGTRHVIAAMQEDVLREGAGEIVDSREARAAIGKKTADLFKTYLRARAVEAFLDK